MNSKKKPTTQAKPNVAVCDPNIKESASVTLAIQDSTILQKVGFSR